MLTEILWYVIVFNKIVIRKITKELYGGHLLSLSILYIVIILLRV